MTPPRKTSSPLDRIIAESKQVTSDLMVLRHELQREMRSRSFGRSSTEQRLYLVLTNMQRICDEIQDAWMASVRSTREAAEFQYEKCKLGEGQLALTEGDR